MLKPGAWGSSLRSSKRIDEVADWVRPPTGRTGAIHVPTMAAGTGPGATTAGEAAEDGAAVEFPGEAVGPPTAGRSRRLIRSAPPTSTMRTATMAVSRAGRAMRPDMGFHLPGVIQAGRCRVRAVCPRMSMR